MHIKNCRKKLYKEKMFKKNLFFSEKLFENKKFMVKKGCSLLDDIHKKFVKKVFALF